MLNMEISQQHVNPQAFEVCRILSADGYQAFIVGGCVRDLLLGVTPKDWDITTDASPSQVMKLFPKNIPTGLQHGTVTVVMGEGVENHFEVTTFRIEGAYSDGRRPEEVFFVMNVEEDLARRDLTINAIAFDPITNRLVDPFHGIVDLELGIIQAVGSAEARFKEDGLRIMRAARFASRFDYSINAETFEGMKSSVDTLRKVSKERVQDELCKILMTKSPSFGLQVLRNCGALEIACPFLTSHPTYLYFILHQDKCQGDLETRLAFLYGNCTPVESVQKELLSLKFSNTEIKRVVFLHNLLDRYSAFIQKDNASAYKSFMALIKNHAPDPWLYTLEQFILLTEAMGFESRAMFDKYQAVTVLVRTEMVLNGDDLILIGIKPGPQIKSILDACYMEILRNPENNNREFLLDFAAGV